MRLTGDTKEYFIQSMSSKSKEIYIFQQSRAKDVKSQIVTAWL